MQNDMLLTQMMLEKELIAYRKANKTTIVANRKYSYLSLAWLIKTITANMQCKYDTPTHATP